MVAVIKSKSLMNDKKVIKKKLKRITGKEIGDGQLTQTYVVLLERGGLLGIFRNFRCQNPLKRGFWPLMKKSV
jgi:hypothetical protein